MTFAIGHHALNPFLLEKAVKTRLFKLEEHSPAHAGR